MPNGAWNKAKRPPKRPSTHGTGRRENVCAAPNLQHRRTVHNACKTGWSPLPSSARPRSLVQMRTFQTKSGSPNRTVRLPLSNQCNREPRCDTSESRSHGRSKSNIYNNHQQYSNKNVYFLRRQNIREKKHFFLSYFQRVPYLKIKAVHYSLRFGLFFL